MRALPLGSCLVLCLSSSWAAAYVPSTTVNTLSPLRWMGSNCVMIRVNSNGSADVPGQPAVAAATRAIDNWMNVTAGCSYLRFQILDESPTAVAEFNKNGPNENVIEWVEKGWVEKGGAHDAHAAALTTVFFVEKEGSDGDGQILDADIELNGAFFRFSDSGEPGFTDIENTVTHELGHLMGLDHICDDNAEDGKTPKDNLGNPAPSCFPVTGLPTWMREVTMYNFADPGETKKRSPEADDIQGICDTYPKQNDPGKCSPPVYVGDDHGCSIGGRGAASSVAVLLLLGFALVRRRREA